MLSLVLIERFSGFQLQDKHNASIKRTWLAKSESKNSEILEYDRDLLGKILLNVVIPANLLKHIY